MKSIKLTYIVFAFLIVIAGCRKDEKTERQIIKNPTGNPTIEVESGVTGLVVDENDNPISNAQVTVYDKEVTTDENGVFYINNEGLRQTKSNVTVKRDGFFDGFKSFIPALGKKSFIKIEMLSKGSPTSILSSEGGSISINGGANLSLPANGIAIKDGGAMYSGNVEIVARWFDPTDPELGLFMPGNLSGITSDEIESQLGTYGMIAVEMKSPDGISLRLDDNAKATLRFPAFGSLDPPESIALWIFDESNGNWVQDGVATLEVEFYLAEVSRVSLLNSGVPFPQISIEGKILDDGVPVANFPVTISVDNLISGHGFTDNEGIFRGEVPRGEIFNISLRHCRQTIYTQELGPFEEDLSIPNIDIDIEFLETVVRGRMVGCNFEPLQSAYGLLRSGEDVVQVITPIADGTDSDGTFFTVVPGCQNGNYSIQFFNPENGNSTGIMDINTSANINELGDVRICNDQDEFIMVTREGDETFQFTDANVYYSNEDKLIIRSSEPNLNLQFRLELFAQEVGDFNPSNLSIDNTGAGGSNMLTVCGDDINNFYDCNKVNVNIKIFGDFIEGTFTGLLMEVLDTLQLELPIINERLVDGAFRLKIDENITTGEIAGQLWFDENDNNINDEDEERPTPIMQATINKLDNYQYPIFPVTLGIYEGFYKFPNLLPGNYIVEIEGNSQYFAVTKYIGSQEIDSDFNNVNGGKFLTDEINISSNEVFGNVDLGFQVPDSVICGSLNFEGCSPSILLSTTIISGLPPYQASLDGGDLVLFWNEVQFIVPEGGIHIIEVFDAVGNNCTSSANVYSFNNTISGRLWRDIDGGISNIFDGNDENLSDITVALFNENGEFVNEVLAINGLYTFVDVTPGIYYVEVIEIGSLEFLTQNVDITNGNDINPDTGRSDIFTVGNCNFSIQIDAGFK